MNIYEKLQNARVELNSKALKKTGHNKHMNFKYYELDDFLPETMRIFKEFGLCSFVSFNEDRSVTLTLVNSEAPEEIIKVSSPSEKCVIPKAQEIQNLGGEHTYQRRYLYISLMELTEPDSVDPLPQSENSNDERTQIKKEFTGQWMTDTRCNEILKNKNSKEVKQAIEYYQTDTHKMSNKIKKKLEDHFDSLIVAEMNGEVDTKKDLF